MTSRLHSRARVAAPLAAFAVLAAGGCASVPHEAGFPQVQKDVSARTEQKLQWHRSPEDEANARTAMHELLRDELTLDAAVRVALLNNRGLQAEYAGLGISQADLVQAGLLSNPVLFVTAIYGDPGSELTVDLVQELIGLLTLSARKQVAGAAFEATKLRVAQAALQLIAEVKTAYYTVEGDEQALELFQTAASATEAAAELAFRQRSAGTLNRRDQSLHQAFYAQTLLEVARTQAQMRADRERLNRLLGLWGEDTRWKLPHRLPEVPPDTPPLDHLEVAAIDQRLDLAAARRDVEVVYRAAGITRSTRYLSALGIGVEFKRDPGGSKFAGPVVELGLPLFDQGQARVAGAEAQVKRSEELLRALAVDIRSEVRETRDRMTAAQEQARYYRDVLLPLQQTILDETLLRYNGMLLGIYDLLLAKQGQLNSARDYIMASRDYWIARAELERAVGGRLPAGFSTPAASAAPSNVGGEPHQHGGNDR